MDGIVFGESPRWRDGRLWFSGWGAGQVFSVAADGTPTVEAAVTSFPMCIDFLPDGRLLVVSSAARQLLRLEPGRALVVHADLALVSTKPWNIVVDGRGKRLRQQHRLRLPRRGVRAGDRCAGQR